MPVQEKNWDQIRGWCTCLLLRIHLTTIIDKSRKISIKSEATDDADYKIYSDGSCLNNGVGAAAIIYKKNRITPLKSLKVYLGSPEDHNTYEAEIIGTILAIWILKNSVGWLKSDMSQKPIMAL